MASAKASSSAPPMVKSDKKVKIKLDPNSNSTSTSTSKSKTGAKDKSKAKPPQAISPEEVPSDIDSEKDEDAAPAAGSSSSLSSSSSEVDSDENLEDITPRRSTKTNDRSAAQEKRGKSLKKYEPPIGMSELRVSSAFTSSPFEWDALASKPGVELWAIRVPRDLKPSRLSSLQLQIPKSTSASSSSSVTGSLKTKSTTYTLSTAGTSVHTRAVVDQEGRQPTAGPGAVDSLRMDVDGQDVHSEMKVEGGEEMDGLRLLVPKIKAGGKLYAASKSITRKLILTPSLSPSQADQHENEHEHEADLPAVPSFLSEPKTSSAITQDTELPPKRAQPSHLLKFRNHAYGFTTPGPGPQAAAVKAMEVDDHPDIGAKGAEETETPDKKEKKDKEKKRKSENRDKDSPKKKSKKSKD
ncbi:uncharacterized protein I303_100746 [Kwoniella dejecticola CBS 10117]|uniref:DNA-directed RNA polymerase I subunit RPA34.5 n=1 Tax=Kwoniella dejecticola CBS 10117 TaxID=1296121 RepID=A0A1A6AFU6_9TREE|nr:uncharacterized protein I303_00749 [Kwoniella dejecticola CBS 10117]OBR88931.1 hypothetical protein I303_00749 [Kwoniella dejecticola CBS 10117]